jgi:hypothetical protein
MLSNAKTTSSQKLGQDIIIGGLCVQIIFFGFFMIVTLLFHRRISINPTPRSMSITVPWKKFIFVLYTVSLFIMIRSVFRVAEYVGGTDGVLQSTEVYVYIFDATLMFTAVSIFSIFHPSRIIAADKERLQLADTEEAADSYPMYMRRDQSDYSLPQDVPTPDYSRTHSPYSNLS